MVLISLARVMLFRAKKNADAEKYQRGLNLSCESNAFQGTMVLSLSVSSTTRLNLSCESNAFQGQKDEW